jgi:NADH:ubiquinone oxidoreductase subunit K/NADH:ubiquinone oxidoreductase subunit 6 (subunit J)
MMESLFYLAGLVAVIATIAALTRSNAAHALIYLIVSLLAVAVMFFLMGAPFAAALEIVIYAGAIMVLFVFVIMMLNLGETGITREREWLNPRFWVVPGIMAALLLFELLLAMSRVSGNQRRGGHTQSRRPVAVRALRAGCGDRLDAAVGRSGGGLPPGQALHRKTRGATLMSGLAVPMHHVLLLAGILFSCGLLGLMLRRNIIFMLMSLEVMLNAAALAFVAAGARWGQADGQVVFLLILSVAAAEVAVGLGLVLQIQRRFKTLDMDQANRLRG